jgi:hypothetical protein
MTTLAILGGMLGAGCVIAAFIRERRSRNSGQLDFGLGSGIRLTLPDGERRSQWRFVKSSPAIAPSDSGPYEVHIEQDRARIIRRIPAIKR